MWAGLAVGALLSACGGEIASIEADGGGPGSDASTPSSSGVDASGLRTFDSSGGAPFPTPAPPPSSSVGDPTCVGAGSSGGGSSGACNFIDNETCGGMTYTVQCSCPSATCYCSQYGGSGGSSSGPVPFAGCADQCLGSIGLAYQACGFPSYY